MTRVIVCAALLLAGCATTSTDGVVKIGQDQYMIGTQGNFSDYSGSAVKARLYQQGAEYCASKGRQITPIASTGQDAAFATYASAEIQFRCDTIRSDR